MSCSRWQRFGCALLLASAVATYSVAQETTAQGSAQVSNQSGSTQGNVQESASSDRGSTSQDSSQKNQASSNSSNSSSNQGVSQQNANQNNDRSSANSSNSKSSNDNQAQSNRSGSSASNRSASDRSDSRRDSRDYDRDSTNRSGRDDRSVNDRSDRSTSRDGDSRHEMRSADIGIWFSRNSRDGLIIADVASKGAIARFGFHEGDRIVSVNGHRVTAEADFVQYVLHSDVDRVKIIVVRDGREEVIYVEPQVLTREYQVENTEVDPLERFGIIVDDRYDDRIVVWRVIPRSPAYYAGFRPGDVVVNFGGRPYKTRTEFERGAGEWKEGEVNVEIRRGDKTRQLSADVPKYERSNIRTAEGTDRQTDRQERRSDRASGNQNGRRGPGILNRGR